jgi:hypothetical protein
MQRRRTAKIVISETIQTICKQIGKNEGEICNANLTESGSKAKA